MDITKVCRVGYALNPKKLRKSSIDKSGLLPDSPVKKTSTEWRGGGLSDILDNSCENDGVQFILWDFEVPLEEQPELDVIIHKLTEDIDRKESAEKMKALVDYLALYPNTAIVDPIDSVRKVISRSRTCSHLKEVELAMGAACPFRQPKYVIFEDTGSEISPKDTLDVITRSGLTFPIICKPVEACGTAISHHMVVIVSPEDIHMMVKPCVVQQYYNHDANFFKVYVIDTEVMVFQRSSLPNLSIHQPLDSGRCTKRSLDYSDKCCSDSVATSDSNETPDCHLNKRITLKSVAFDSRKHYPTFEDFLVDPSSVIDLKTTSTVESVTATVDTNCCSFKLSSCKDQSSVSVTSEGEHYSWKTKKNTRNNCSRSNRVITRASMSKESSSVDIAASHEVIEVKVASENTLIPVVPVLESEKSRDLISEYMNEFKAAAVALQQEFQLSLFGFDVIIPNISGSATDEPRDDARDINFAQLGLTSNSVSGLLSKTQKLAEDNASSKIVVIDVNYFPSYKEVKDFPQRLRRFLKSKTSNSNS